MMGGRDPHGYGWPRELDGGSQPKELEAADPRLRVGVIDTGIVERGGVVHEWLAGHVEYLENDVDHGVHEEDLSAGHGTFVAGVVLQQAPTATVVMRRALLNGPGDDDAVANAIRTLKWAGVTLINLSFGGSLFEHRTPSAISKALEELPSDVVVVGAAANNGLPLRTYPAAEDGVLAVGAATADGEIAEFSANGSWINLYAVGEDVVGPYLDGFRKWSGTSFAAAVVTGRIARLMADGMDVRLARRSLFGECRQITVHGVNGARSASFLPPR